MRFIFLFLILRNTIDYRKLNFSARICKVGKKRENAKLFASIRSKNWVLHGF